MKVATKIMMFDALLLPDFITFFRHQIAAIDLQLVRYNFGVA